MTPSTTAAISAAIAAAMRDGGVSVTELATMRGIERPTAHATLARLVEIGTLVRVRDETKPGHPHRYYYRREG